MKFNLKNKVLPNGFNKRAVVIALGIVAIIIAGFITYVTTNNTIRGNNASTEEPQKIEINDDAANQSSIIDITNSKPIASMPVAKIDKTILPITSNSVFLPQQKMIETEYDKQAKQIEEQAKMKKLQAQFAAPGSKSSMTSNAIKSNASSASIQLKGKSTSQKTNASIPVSSNGGATSTYLDSELVKPKSPYLIQAGSIIPCVMISGINSDISGQVIAQVRENVYDSISSRYLLIPQGSKLIGSFSNQIAYGQQRLGVAWTRIIYPNGYSIDLRGIPGSDVSGFSGFYDQVDNHYWSIFGSSFVIGIITAGMQYSQNNTNPNVQIGGIGVSTNPTVGQTIAGSLGQQLGQTAMMITQKGLNVAPTLTIRQGYMFTVMLTADVALKPYK
ncbi:MAG: hypothetical protein ORN24_06890 [Burkholderiales bacterium]|nr:hypothetical protein [Burkholderiales bacterium]